MQHSIPSEAFSRVAPSYDRDFGSPDIVPALRRRVLQLIQQHAPTGSRLLEIGAGTGEDAKELYELGYSVIATDISPGMLERARKKLGGIPVQVQELSAEEVPRKFPPDSFDVLFSNFGALNCIADLPGLLPQLAALLAPGVIMVVCLLGKYPFWEMTAAGARLRFRTALRRLSRGAVLAAVGDRKVPVWYYSLSAVRAACRGWGKVIDVAGLNIVSPPPGSQTFARRFSGIAGLLDRLDRRIEGFPFLSTLGDHLVVVMRRTNPE